MLCFYCEAFTFTSSTKNNPATRPAEVVATRTDVSSVRKAARIMKPLMFISLPVIFIELSILGLVLKCLDQLFASPCINGLIYSLLFNFLNSL